MSEDLTSDPLGQECIDHRDEIRAWVKAAHKLVSQWSIPPCPPDWEAPLVKTVVIPPTQLLPTQGSLRDPLIQGDRRARDS